MSERVRGISGHEPHYEGDTNVWLTPKWLIDVLGPFDLDPCAATIRQFDCAKRNIIEAEDGLRADWFGFVWMNPPYGPHLGKWFAKMIDHRNGISLTFARCETEACQAALGEADAVLFPAGRFRFSKEDGEQGEFTSGAPSMLLAFGMPAVARLLQSGIEGVFFFKGRRVANEAQRSLLDWSAA